MKLPVKIQHFLVSEDGPTAVEYAVMLALIILACMTTIGTLGQYANATFEHIEGELETRGTGG